MNKKSSKNATRKATAKQKRMTLEKIGSIRVASGMLWVSDPSQIVGGGGLFVDWPDFLDKSSFSHEHQAKHRLCMAPHQEGKPITPDMRVEMMPVFKSHALNAGIAIRTPYGDGMYDVYVKRDSSGAMEEIRIML